MFVTTDLSVSTDDETQTVKVTDTKTKMTGQSNKHTNNMNTNTSIISTIVSDISGIGQALAVPCAHDELGYVWSRAPVYLPTAYTARRGHRCDLAA